MMIQHQGSDKKDPPSTVFPMREPNPSDGAPIRDLIASCPPLDVNSTYCYLLIASHFHATSVVAGEEGALGGFVSGYLKPEDPETLFIWQVAVGSKARGQGLARRMIEHILARPACANVRRLETTVSPSNAASRALFQSLARRLGAACETRVLFGEKAFGGEQHESEELYRIGPFTPKTHIDQQETAS